MLRLVSRRALRLRLLIVAGCVAGIVAVLSIRSCTGADTPAFEPRVGGAVWALGQDCRGQLGDGPAHREEADDCAKHDDVLVKVEGIDDAVKVQAMNSSVFALLGDGTVWAWGANDHGQLGDGTTTDREAPVQVPGLSQVVDLATGRDAVYAVRADGRVWMWSVEGNDKAEDWSVPHQFPGLSGVVQVSPYSSYGSFWALRADGTVMASGCPNAGSGGSGWTAPTMVAGLSDVVQVGPSSSSGTLAVKQDGTVWTWDGGCDDPAPARQVPDLTGIAGLGAGTALDEDGTLWSWSENRDPTKVSGLTDIVAVTGVSTWTDDSSTPPGTYAVRRDGSVWVLPSGSSVSPSASSVFSLLTPTSARLVPALPAATQATASAHAFFVIEGDDSPDRGETSVGPALTPVSGPVISWDLGTDTTEPVPTGVERATSLAASRRHGFETGYALLDDGTVVAWGNNRTGELGNATSDEDVHLDPTPIQGFDDVSAVANVSGYEDPAAIDTDGRVWLWGSTHAWDGGVRGPSLLTGIDGVAKLVGAFALRQDGTVWSWASSARPTLVPGLAQVADIITIGQGDAAILQADGMVWIADQSRPDELRSTGVNATALVGVGEEWVFAAAADGTVWAVPSSADEDAVPVVGLTDVTKIVRAGNEGYLALRVDGSLWAFTDPTSSIGPGPMTAPLPPVVDVAVVGGRVYTIANP